MVDFHYTEPRLATLYDAFCAGRPDFRFYLPLVLAAERVLDVGCGTGELLRLARAAGHTGRLTGLDPAPAMLDVARARSDIDWVLGDFRSQGWDRAFDLVIMTGHAFQALTEDSVLRSTLAGIRSALAADGRFIFETRNPLAREWVQWSPEAAPEEIEQDGLRVRMSFPEQPVAHGDLVTFVMAYTSPAWDRPQVSRSTIRFLSAEALAAYLADAGLAIDEQYGDWDRSPFTESSPEIITVARRA